MYDITLIPSEDFDSNLYVLSDCANIASGCLAANEEPGSGVAEHLTVELEADTDYYIVVDGYGNSTNFAGAYELIIDDWATP